MKKSWRLISFLLFSIFNAIQFTAHAQSAQTRTGVDQTPAVGQPQLVAQVGHQSSIEAIAFSPDGRLMLSASYDAAVLWEVATGREIRRFLGKAVQLEPFSDDARYVMTASVEYTGYGQNFTSDWFEKTTEHLFDATTGNEVRFIAPGTEGYWAVAISRDNRLVATADYRTNIVRLWDVETRRQLRQVPAFSKDFNGAIGFTRDDRYLLTIVETDAKQAARVQLWDPATGAEVRRFAGEYLRQSPSSRYLLTRVDDTTYLWEMSSGKEVRRFLSASEADFSADNNYLAIGDEKTKKSHLYELATGREVGALDGLAVVFSRDGRFVMTQAELNARVWNVADATLVRSFPAERAEFSPDGRFVMTTNKLYADKEKQRPARLFEIATGQEALRFADYSEGVYVARFSPDGRFVATTGDSQNQVRLWEIAAGREAQSFGGRFMAGSFEVSPDDRWAMTKSRLPEKPSEQGDAEAPRSQTAAQLWDLNSGQVVNRFEFEGTTAAFSPDSRAVVIDGHDSSLRDVATWQELRRFKGDTPLFLPDGRLIATGDNDYMYLSEVETGNIVRRFKVKRNEDFPDAVERFIAFSPNGRYGLSNNTYIYYEGPKLWDLQTGRMVRQIEEYPLGATAFSPDGRSLLVGTVSFADGGGGGTLCRYGVPGGKTLQCYEGMGYGITQVAFTADNRNVMASGSNGLTIFWNKLTGGLVRRVVGEEAQLSPDGRRLLTIEQNRAHLWNTADGRELMSFEHSTGVGAVGFMRGGRIALTSSSDSALRFWDTATGKEMARLVASAQGNWVVIAPDGRFDTNNLDSTEGLHWVTSDAPFTSLPLEIFMRDYYEPRLLGRILAGERFKALPDIAQLNRVQPEVSIKSIVPDSAETVSVTVEVARGRGEFKQGTKSVVRETGVYDLRLFRNGQLVGYAPEKSGEVPVDEQTGRRTLTFERIKLPRSTDHKPVEFSAYAFNVDRVKSATARRTFTLAASLPPRKGRAYLIAVGVNAYENAAFDLSFAANDARRLQRTLSDGLAQTGEYAAQNIVRIPLISDYEERGKERVVTVNDATKRKFQAVIDLLAGRPIDAQLQREIPHADQIEPARPEDVVLLSVSGHGYAVPSGEFYFILADTGPGTEKVATPELLRRAVSSEELSVWLRDVDAGEMVLIVDACQSTAVVERQGFKPGPMDSRGLGQLSYDKGMRILTATQADNVALESDLAQQGLLTFALVRDGLEARRADFKPRDRRITLSEWLAYGVERVPKLYEEVERGALKSVGRETAAPTTVSLITLPERSVIARDGGATPPRRRQQTSATKEKIQQPALFDFARQRADLVLVRN